MFGIKPAPRNTVWPRTRRPEVEVLEDRSLLSVSPAFFIAGSAHDETAPATASSANGTSIVVWAQTQNNGDRDISLSFTSGMLFMPNAPGNSAHRAGWNCPITEKRGITSSLA